MSTVDSKHMLDAQLQMHTPQGETIDVHLTEVFALSNDGKLQEVMIAFDIPSAQYNTIINPNEYFNSHIDRREGNPRLEEETPIEIKARLTTVQTVMLRDKGDRASDVADALRDVPADSELLKTESWYALEVKQEVPVPPEVGDGTLKSGYRLSW